MVKTPRTRHSRTGKEPVTIDLAPDDVSRVKDGSEPKATQAQPSGAAKTAAKSGAGSSGVKPDTAKAAEATPGEAPRQAGETREEAAPAAGSARFGRQDGREGGADKRTSAPEAASGQQAQPRSRGRAGGAFFAGLVGGVAALAIAAGLQFSGLLPGLAPSPSPQDAVDHGPAIAGLESGLADLAGRVDALAAAQDGDGTLAADLAGAQERLSTLASGLESLRDDVSALSSRPAGEDGAAAPVDLSPVEDRIAAVESALAALPDAAAQQSAVSSLEQRLAALSGQLEAGRDDEAQAAARLEELQEEVRVLAGRVDEQAQAPATAIIIAASSLKAAIDRGSPFATELETYAALVPDAPQLDELRALAAAGVPTRAQIAAEADAAANAMIAAARPVDPQAGVVDRLWDSMMGLVQVRPIGMVEGEGVPEIAARLDAAVRTGDYERALAEYDTLPAEAKAAGEPFIARLRARHAADRLADEALAAALKA